MDNFEFAKKKRYTRVFTEFDENLLVEVSALSGRGLNQGQIAGYYGISRSTWEERLKEFPELKEAFKKGKCKAIAKVSGCLMRQIEEGNTNATIFYLKTQARWKEDKGENEQKREPQNLTINVTDPVEAAKIYQDIMRGD